MTDAERDLVFGLCERLYIVSQHLSRLAERPEVRGIKVAPVPTDHLAPGPDDVEADGVSVG